MANNQKDIFHFFWSGNSVFSQWHKSSFTDEDEQKYVTCEQYMMAQKAKLFNDMKAYEEILKTASPKKCKSLGRKVKGFDEKTWCEHREQIVYNGNLLKFSQNPDLKKILLDTGDKIIVEASPYDKIWGIGIRENNPNATNPAKWRGLNLLGKALSKVRTELNK